MKLSKSKLALAKIINENGGWFGDAENAAQDRDGDVDFYSRTPRRIAGRDWWSADGVIGGSRIRYDDGAIKNWHQCVLSREEYYQAYPKADADGWIEWKGGECPVEPSTKIGVRYRNGGEFHSIITAASQRWSNNGWPSDIIAYRLHKPDVKPEFCESVTRSIPEPEAKPTIEHLAQDYRNKLDYSSRKQQEADDAKAAADAALGELERAGEALGLLIGIAKPDQEQELVITDWRNLLVGDIIEIVGSENKSWLRFKGVELFVTRTCAAERGLVFRSSDGDEWCHSGNTNWRFIRRP